MVRVCRPGGTIGLLSWTPEGMLGALFRTMRPVHAAAPAGRPARRRSGAARTTCASCSATASASTPRAASCSRSPRSRGPRDYARALQGPLRPDDRRPQERREGGPRGGVRRGAGPLLRRVGPRHARGRPLREGVPAQRWAPGPSAGHPRAPRPARGASRMPSLRYALERWTSTVFGVTKSAWAMSRLVAPPAARSATRRSDAVSAATPATASERGRAPAA